MVFSSAGLVHRLSEDPVLFKVKTLSRFFVSPSEQACTGIGVGRRGNQVGGQIVEAVKAGRPRCSKDNVSRPSEIDTDELRNVIRARSSLEKLSLISRTRLDSELLVINPQ